MNCRFPPEVVLLFCDGTSIDHEADVTDAATEIAAQLEDVLLTPAREVIELIRTSHSDVVRLRAAKDILNRAGVRVKQSEPTWKRSDSILRIMMVGSVTPIFMRQRGAV